MDLIIDKYSYQKLPLLVIWSVLKQTATKAMMYSGSNQVVSLHVRQISYRHMMTWPGTVHLSMVFTIVLWNEKMANRPAGLSWFENKIFYPIRKAFICFVFLNAYPAYICLVLTKYYDVNVRLIYDWTHLENPTKVYPPSSILLQRHAWHVFSVSTL